MQPVPQQILEQYHSGEIDNALAERLEAAARDGKIDLQASAPMQVAGQSVVDSGQVDRDRGAGFGTRSLASIKATEAGRLNYLKHKFGDANVAKDTKGEIVFRESEGFGWRALDEDGFEWADIADFSGDAIEAGAGAAGALTSIVGTGGVGVVASGAIGGIAGNAARQGLSALLPGSDEASAGGRLKQSAVSGAVGGVAGVAGLAGKKAFEAGKGVVQKAVHGRSAVEGARMLRREVAESTERKVKSAAAGLPQLADGTAEKVIAEGDQLAKEIGPLSAGQVSQSQPQLRREALARNNEATSQQIREFDRLQLQSAESKITQAMDSITGKESTGAVGAKVKKAYEGVVGSYVRKRRMQAKADFAALDSAAGRARVFGAESLENFRGVIEDVMESSLPPTSRIQQDKSFKAAQGLLGNIDEGWSASDMQNTLSFFSKASAGTGKLFPDLDSGLNRMVAGRLQKALERDLDIIAETGKGIAETAPQDILGLVKVARDNYRVNSQAIDKLRNTALGRITKNKNIGAVLDDLGNDAIEDGDKIVKAVNSLSAGELRMTRSILETHDPAALASLQRAKIQSLVDKAPAAATSGDAQFADISAAGFFNQFRKNKDQLKSLLPEQQYKEIAQISSYMQRVANRGATGESPTGGYLMQLIGAVLPSGRATSVINTGVQVVAKTTGGQTHSVTTNMMMDAKARKAMIMLAKADGNKSAKSAEAASYLSAYLSTGEDFKDSSGVD